MNKMYEKIAISNFIMKKYVKIVQNLSKYHQLFK